MRLLRSVTAAALHPTRMALRHAQTGEARGHSTRIGVAVWRTLRWEERPLPTLTVIGRQAAGTRGDELHGRYLVTALCLVLGSCPDFQQPTGCSLVYRGGPQQAIHRPANACVAAEGVLRHASLRPSNGVDSSRRCIVRGRMTEGTRWTRRPIHAPPSPRIHLHIQATMLAALARQLAHPHKRLRLSGFVLPCPREVVGNEC